MTEETAWRAHRGFTRNFYAPRGRNRHVLQQRPSLRVSGSISETGGSGLRPLSRKLGTTSPQRNLFLFYSNISFFFVLKTLQLFIKFIHSKDLAYITIKLLFPRFSHTHTGRGCTLSHIFVTKFFWFNPTFIWQIWLPWMWIFMRNAASRKHLFY